MTLLHRIAAPVALICFMFLALPNNAQASCVYLKPIKIKVMEVGNMLSWSTTQEVDNMFFVIEKSEDGINFKRIGDVKGAGYSEIRQDYRFLDFSLNDKKAYYRLLHYGSDESYTVSETYLLSSNLKITSISSTITDKKITLTFDSTMADANMAFFINVRIMSGVFD